MGHRLTKIYTRTGDTGTTGLGDGTRRTKFDLRVCCYGDIDELNSSLGIVRAHVDQSFKAPSSDAQIIHQAYLSRIQHQLFDLGGELSIPEYRLITTNMVIQLEQEIDLFNESLPPLKNFILPAGNLLISHIHLSRTICRRAERLLAQLCHLEPDQTSQVSLSFVNRLSDWLFVYARVIAAQLQIAEVLWQPTNSSNQSTNKPQESES